MVGKERAGAKLPGKARAGGGEAPAPQLTLFSTSRAYLQSSDLQASVWFFFLKQVLGGGK